MKTIRKIFLILTFLVLSACSASSDNDSNIHYTLQKPDLSGKWFIKSIDGTELLDEKRPFNKNKPYLEFVSKDRVSGFGGCNKLYASYKLIEPNEIKIGPMMITSMACIPDLFALERKVIAHLDSAQNYKFTSENKLVLRSKGGMQLILEKD